MEEQMPTWVGWYFGISLFLYVWITWRIAGAKNYLTGPAKFAAWCVMVFYSFGPSAAVVIGILAILDFIIEAAASAG